GNAQRPNFLQINDVALAVNRLSVFVKLELSTRWRVVAAGRGSLDYESIHLAVGLLQHGRRQGIGSDDGEELWPGQRGEVRPHEVPRREFHDSVVIIVCPGDLE